MEEEIVPKKKTEEVKEVKQEIQEDFSDVDSKKGRVWGVISRIVWTLITIFVIFEVVMGLLNMQRINDDKEPLWCFNKTEEKTKNKTEKTCHLGLYVIVKTKEGTETKTALKPFFLK